jgi:hypothetical protein
MALLEESVRAEGGDQRECGGRRKVGCLGDKMSEGVDRQRWDGVVMRRAARKASKQGIDGILDGRCQRWG